METNQSNPAPPSGFTQITFANPYEVIAFPQSDSFFPVKCLAIGEETCNKFGTKRLIVRYLENPVRKSTGVAEFWPGNLLYLAARDVEGWKS